MTSEIDDDDLDLEGSSFDEFDQAEKTTLGDLWRNNSAVKFGVIAVAAIAVLGIIVAFGGSGTPPDQSFVSAGSEVKGTPGAEEATPAYVDAVEETTQARIEKAQREGTSALPTPVAPPVGRLDVPEIEREEEDPLQRWRQIQEERLQRELEQTRIVEGPIIEDVEDQTEAIQAFAEIMSEQMQAILESQNVETRIQSKQITSPDFLKGLQEQEELEEALGVAPEEAPINPGTQLLPAGEIVYAQLITEANSDIPGPVLADILSGPLKGNRIIGDFQVTGELITLNFSTIVYKNKGISVDAVAVDPGTTLPGMATEVNRRLLKRIFLPMAAAFVEGAAEAIANTGRTTITVEGDTVAQQEEEASNEEEIASGIEEAGTQAQLILNQMAAQTRVLVRIASGTPIGILFLSEVVEAGDSVTNQ